MKEPAVTAEKEKPFRWNWRALLFELAIVFIGLLAALQVDDFRQQREFREAQRRYLVRMHEDLAGYLENSEEIIRFLEEVRDAVDHVWRSLQAGEIVGGDAETFERGLIYLGHLPSNPLPRAAYDEMVASGSFSSLESMELQRAVSRLFSLHDFVESNFDWWRDNFLFSERYVYGRVDFYDDPGTSSRVPFALAEPRRRVSYDIDELAGDRAVRNAIYWARDVRSDWLEWTIRLKHEAEATHRILDAQLRREE